MSTIFCLAENALYLNVGCLVCFICCLPLFITHCLNRSGAIEHLFCRLLKSRDKSIILVLFFLRRSFTLIPPRLRLTVLEPENLCRDIRRNVFFDLRVFDFLFLTYFLPLLSYSTSLSLIGFLSVTVYPVPFLYKAFSIS